MTLPPVVWKGNLVDLSGSDSDGEVGRSGHAILAAVHHRMVGSLESTIREFTDASASGQSRRVSSQFGIGFLGTELLIVQFVALENTAYCNGQTARDKAACTWPLWIKAGKPDANRITYSIEHEDNAGPDYIVRPEIVEASIALDKLLLAGDGAAIRKAGIHCSDAAAAQLRKIRPTVDTIVDHHVVAPVSKPFCWRRIGKDAGFPQAKYLAALTEVDVPVLNYKHIDGQPDSGPGTVIVNGAGHSAILLDGNLFPLANGTKKHSYGLVRFAADGKYPNALAYLIGEDGGYLLKQDVTYVADKPPDVAAAVKAARAKTATDAAAIVASDAATTVEKIKQLGA